MPPPYSYDLRIKVIEAIDGGMRKTEASKIFKISRNTINFWLQRREETGDYQATSGYQQGYGGKISDLDAFRDARKHGSQTQAEMAAAWPEEISDKTIGKALKKIRFTRKKTYGYQETDETKRQDFLAKISQKNRDERVYIDESGIDNRSGLWLRLERERAKILRPKIGKKEY